MLISCTLISIKLLLCLSCEKGQGHGDSCLERFSFSLPLPWAQQARPHKDPREPGSGRLRTVNTKGRVFWPQPPLWLGLSMKQDMFKYETGWTPGQKILLPKVQFLLLFKSRKLRPETLHYSFILLLFMHWLLCSGHLLSTDFSRTLDSEKEMGNSKLFFEEELGTIHQPHDTEIQIHILDFQDAWFSTFNIVPIGVSHLQMAGYFLSWWYIK